MTYQALKDRHRQERDNYHPNLSLRVHRALSWLNRAEQAEDDDGRMVFLWIAFNAAYATDLEDHLRLTEKESFQSFIRKLCELDKSAKLYNQIWSDFANNIRIFLDNPYVYAAFWHFQRGQLSETEWKAAFTAAKAAAMRALGNKETAKVISIILGRVYTLRNQVMHGGATWNSQINREQVREAARFLSSFVPTIIEIMMDNPDTLWGDPCYPVVSA